MKGCRINPDKEYVDKIINGVFAKGGYCPCKIQKTEENLCPCNEFLETQECHCKLWVKSN